MSSKPVSRILRHQTGRPVRFLVVLLSTTTILGLAAGPARAQINPVAAPQSQVNPPVAPGTTPQSSTAPSTDVTPGDRDEVAAKGADQSALDVVVTGSRIVRDGYQSPTPLSVIGSDQLATSTSPNIAQFVTTLPAFAGSANSRSATVTGANGQAGLNTLNLRALGPTRTLVLLDGHRVTPATPYGFVDVNAIPQTLLSRVDVVTGGASATYGSDAVAGVVNFVLNRSLTGLVGEVSGGITNYGDNKNYKVSVAGGTGFAGGRGHILVSAEQAHENGIPGGSRPWTRVGRQILFNPAYTATNGQPQRLILSNVGYLTAAPGGIIASGPLAGIGFGAGGQPYTLNRGDLQADPYLHNGDWQQGDLRPYNSIAPEETRTTVFGRANFEISPAFNVYAQASYIRSRNYAISTSAYMIGTSGPLIQIDNAYLPDSVRTQMAANGLSSIRVGTLNFDLGFNGQVTERKASSFTGGVDGKFQMLGSTWKWDAYGQYGSSNNYVSFPTNISRSNYTLATDAVRTASGAIVCRSTLTNPTNGCSPFNALGTGVNGSNAAGIAFIRSPSIQNLKVEQTVAGASVTGSPFSTWAGPLSVALSAEYRKDKAFATVDADSLRANHIYANYSPIDGSTNVKEVAFETAVPLAKGTSWADSLELNGAVRYTSYSLAGDVVTWKGGVTYSPVPDFTFRATRSRDIRAPNLQETFLPQNTARQSIFDPFTNTTPAFNQITTGNPNLRPEKADTLGVGGVFRPSFLPGFSASIDYWSINVKGAISTISASDTLALCFNGARPDLCANITRTNGVLTQVISQNINIANQKVRGLDFEGSYRGNLTPIGLPGSLDIHGNFTLYLEDTVNTGISTPRDVSGENSGTNPPRWRTTASLTYHLDGFHGTLTGRALSSGTQFSYFIQCTTGCPVSTADHPTVNDNYLPGAFYLDLALSYDIALGGKKVVTPFFNARNLTNRDPGLGVSNNAFQNGGNAVLYDVDGVSFRAGARFRF